MDEVVGEEVGRVRVMSVVPFPKETDWLFVCFAESLSPRRRERKEDFGVVWMWSRSEWVVDVRLRMEDAVSLVGDVGFIDAVDAAAALDEGVVGRMEPVRM